MVNRIEYNEQVKIFASGELIGTGHLIGKAEKNQVGRWGWSGNLIDLSCHHGDVFDKGELTIEFDDGATGQALANVTIRSNRNPIVRLQGTGKPPRVTIKDE